MEAGYVRFSGANWRSSKIAEKMFIPVVAAKAMRRASALGSMFSMTPLWVTTVAT